MIRVISSFVVGPANFNPTGPEEDQTQKLISGTGIWSTVVLGTLTCQLKIFDLQEGKVHYNKVSALVRLTFYENLSIGQIRYRCLLSALTGDRIKRVEIRENVSDFSQGQRELSVITRCP